MEQERKDILDRNETEKMCSLVGNEAGEMCSPADTDTCGDGCFAFQGRNRLEEGAGGVLAGRYGYVRLPEGRDL